MKKNNFKLLFVLFAVIFILFVLLNLIGPTPPTTEDFLSSHYDLGFTDFEVKGVVQEKYLSDSHNRPIVVIKNSDDKTYKFYFQTNDEEFYNYVQIGDSVYSKRKSCKAKVWSEKRIRNFNFLE
ncbi:hypothetical protein [Marinifilum caeruleilacunae]|uniref:DUF3139 domain-containing protein n=1 Tax=Marinifilum caeruleilacunae TaxID=2499076 RepID=A0ABX1WXV6_9BACT|nr:hypothetical protein [Marinifilum caeruleilacunae]NOU60941.1 hypothetical protein [Marinifilum caeruleilacunae]